MAPRESSKPSAFLSDEYVVDSSDDQGAAQSVQTDEDGVDHIPETPDKQRKRVKENDYQKRKAASLSMESTSSSDSGEEREDEDRSDVADFVDESASQALSKAPSGNGQPRKKSKTTPTTQRSIPPKQYIPPADFISTSAARSDAAAPATLFLNNDVAGKEVWHITAPANVSLESIKPFAIRAAMRGEPILYSEGKWYRLEDGVSTKKATLAPNGTQNMYVPGMAAVSRTFHLREMINPPANQKGPAANPSKETHFEFQPNDDMPVKPKRKQREGLHMRYKPFGTASAALEESDVGRSSMYIPDPTPLPPADRRAKRGNKSLDNRRSPAAEADSEMVEGEPAATPSARQRESAKSGKKVRDTPKKKDATEPTSPREDHPKKKKSKKSKKNKDRSIRPT